MNELFVMADAAVVEIVFVVSTVVAVTVVVRVVSVVVVTVVVVTGIIVCSAFLGHAQAPSRRACCNLRWCRRD